MSDPNIYMITALTTLTGLAIVTGAALTGWRGWLALKRQQMAQSQSYSENHDGDINSTIGTRIEIADLKERIRKLEAIAAGVDL